LNLISFGIALLGGALNFGIGFGGAWLIKNNRNAFVGFVAFIFMFFAFPALGLGYMYLENLKRGIHGISSFPEDAWSYIALAIILIPWLVGCSLIINRSRSKTAVGDELRMRRR
jgi:hypothetical protein